MFLSVYRPSPSRQNKLTNAMFLDQFSDLLESYVSCDRLFVVSDLNVHFDKPSDPSTSALNVVLDNLSLHQLVNVLSRNIGAIDMHDFRTDVHNLLGSATQSDSTDPLGVYNTCLCLLLDRHAPLVTRTVTDRTSAPWMSLAWLCTGRFMSSSAI